MSGEENARRRLTCPFSSSERKPEHRLQTAAPRGFAALLCCVVFLVPAGVAQDRPTAVTDEAIRQLVEKIRDDARGPYAGIRWFCPDGTTVPARERCPMPGGIQHAQVRDDVARLGRSNGIFLGQILAGSDRATMLDRTNGFSRLKQYQLGQYLYAADDGWILHRARFYRGAFQAEDEEAWGRDFLGWMLTLDSLAATHFYSAREAVRSIPHGQESDLVLTIRNESRIIADEYPAFMDIRVKIHGQPDASDIVTTRRFLDVHRSRTTAGVVTRLEVLLDALSRYYATDTVAQLETLRQRLPRGSAVDARLREVLRDYRAWDPAERVTELADLILFVREAIASSDRGARALVLADLSLALERALLVDQNNWTVESLYDALEKADALLVAAAGSGHLEVHELEVARAAIADALDAADGSGVDDVSTDTFSDAARAVSRGVDWGIGTIIAAFEADVNRYAAFEPLAASFIDDRVRSSALLPLGDIASRLGQRVAEVTGVAVEVQLASGGEVGRFRGLNPGVARGRLVVVQGDAEMIEFDQDAVYALGRAPADLKPVAGIMTVSEGSAVSHVQLLARNLGIPNAALSPDALSRLGASNGEDVFFAVSPRGGVRLKSATAMSASERELVEQRVRSDEKIRVATNRMNLAATELRVLSELRASDSGEICGPKAANLGQLSALFPDNVAPGFIVPFGVFREHMDQAMPGTAGSYWQYLEQTFAESEVMAGRGATENERDDYVLTRLATLRTAIEAMPLSDALVAAVRTRFSEVFGQPLGRVAVFIRSDTNMEDLKDFTGAGLNLTVPNVYHERDVLQAIRRVWASPYRERGYRWRQKYLLNPQDVYPSLLILRSVNVDTSGVMITTGIESGEAADVTVAFNRGVGGAVDGQAAESYLLEADGRDVLLSPARETQYTALPRTGGIERRSTGFNRSILSTGERGRLRELALQMRSLLPGIPGVESDGPFDVELGFEGDRLWLFQVRPFVENRAAASTTYLMEMDAGVSTAETVNLRGEL